MILQSKDNFKEFAKVDEKTGKISFFSKNQSPELAYVPSQGVYSIVDGKICVFYRQENDLYLRIEEKCLKIFDRFISEFKKKDDLHVFSIVDNSQVQLRYEYTPPEMLIPLENDPTPFIEYEDFDFLYFVHSVLGDIGRRNRIFVNCK